MGNTDSTLESVLADAERDMVRLVSGEEVDFHRNHGAAIDALGAEPFLDALFTRFEDSRLHGWLFCFSFVWKDLSYATWCQVLRDVAHSPQAVYQFVWFANTLLGLDVVAVVESADGMEEAKAFVRTEFPTGGPEGGGDWAKGRLEELGIEPSALWRRFALEGAPMRLRATSGQRRDRGHQ